MNLRSLRRPIIGGPKINSDLSLRALVELLNRYEEITIEDVNGQVLDVIGRFSGDAASSRHPFNIILATRSSGGSSQEGVSIAYGVFGGKVPTVNGSVMAADPSRNFLPLRHNSPPGNFLFKVTVVDSDPFVGTVTGVEIIFYTTSDASATPARTATTRYVILARWEDAVIAHAIRESQQFIRIGSRSADTPAADSDYSDWRNFTAG